MFQTASIMKQPVVPNCERLTTSSSSPLSKVLLLSRWAMSRRRCRASSWFRSFRHTHQQVQTGGRKCEDSHMLAHASYGLCDMVSYTWYICYFVSFHPFPLLHSQPSPCSNKCEVDVFYPSPCADQMGVADILLICLAHRPARPMSQRT